MEKQVVIQSFSAVVCAVALIEAPELRTELLASSSDRDPLQWNRFLEWYRLLDPHGFNPNKRDVTRTLVDDLHAQGKTIAVWTVDDPGEIALLERRAELRPWAAGQRRLHMRVAPLDVTGRSIGPAE